MWRSLVLFFCVGLAWVRASNPCENEINGYTCPCGGSYSACGFVSIGYGSYSCEPCSTPESTCQLASSCPCGISGWPSCGGSTTTIGNVVCQSCSITDPPTTCTTESPTTRYPTVIRVYDSEGCQGVVSQERTEAGCYDISFYDEGDLFQSMKITENTNYLTQFYSGLGCTGSTRGILGLGHCLTAPNGKSVYVHQTTTFEYRMTTSAANCKQGSYMKGSTVWLNVESGKSREARPINSSHVLFTSVKLDEQFGFST